MFRRHHPYRPPARFLPAGFRITDYVPKRCINFFQRPDFTNTRSPDPSPLSSPAKSGARPSDDDDAPPTFRLADLFGGDFFGSPNRPTTPASDHHQNAGPSAGPAPTRCPIPPPRRKYKPRRRSSSANLGHRPRDVPPHRSSQWLKKKRTALRKKQADAFERRTARARADLLRLVEQAETLMKPEHMTDEDRIFLKQLANLELDQKLEHDLEMCREQIIHAAAGTEQRKKEHEARDREAEKLWTEKTDEAVEEEHRKRVEEFMRENEEEWDAWYRQEEEEAMRADEQRQRAHDAAERKIREEQECRFRAELTRKAREEQERQRRKEERRRQEEERRRQEEERRKREEERRRREEEEHRLRERRRRELEQLEEMARQLREDIERARRVEMERRRREEEERKLRDEADRQQREARERILREEKERLAREEERQAQLRAEQACRAVEEQVRLCFLTYEAKWIELRTNNSLPPIDVREMPWPLFSSAIFSAEQITYEGVRAFLFHPRRPDMEGKTARDKVKAEVLRFHPDKFNTRIVPKIHPPHQAVAQEIAGAIARILTTIMAEEAE